MKKMKMAMAMGVAAFVLSACGQTGSPEDTQTNIVGGVEEISDSTDEVQKTQNDEIADSDSSDQAESKDEEHSVIGKDDVLESLTGEYGYLSDYGAADAYIYEGVYNSYDVNEPALEIKKNEDGTYRIQIELYRLFRLDDGIGKETEEGIEFTATGPGESKVNGVITLDEDIAAVTIFGQEWLDFAGLSEYQFYKTSDASANQQENRTQAVEGADSESTAEELLDLFINGSISAVDPTDSASAFYITDLKTDSGEWDSFSIGEKVDLDNDGENELIICGPYGGIYLDARDNRVYEFAVAEGIALTLSYTYYNNAVWIMYSNRSSAGFEFYHMEKFEGADNLAAEMNFGEELADPDNAEAGMRYTLNETEISYDEYTELCSRIFAAEVNTN